jgi:hypothetical protein
MAVAVAHTAARVTLVVLVVAVGMLITEVKG